MSLIDNNDQKTLAATVRRFVADQTPLTKVREVAESVQSFDPRVWRALAEDLGLAALIIPAEYDGAGGTVADLTAALRELGAGLVPSPLVASGVLVAGTLLALGDEAACKEWLPRIARGAAIATLAVSEPGNRSWIPTKPTARAVDDGQTTLTGTKTAVLNGGDADVFIVLASDSGRAALYLVEAGVHGLNIEATKTIDTTRTATIHFEQTPATLLAGDTAGALEHAANLANIAIAAEQTGAIRACLRMTTEYAKIRYSFGLPIGTYQGVKHPIADMYVDWSLLDAAVRAAAEAIDASDGDRSVVSVAATSARVVGSPAYVAAARNTMLLHGGIGFTWEHDAHLYFKNAIGSSALLGDTAYQ